MRENVSNDRRPLAAGPGGAVPALEHEHVRLGGVPRRATRCRRPRTTASVRTRACGSCTPGSRLPPNRSRSPSGRRLWRGRRRRLLVAHAAVPIAANATIATSTAAATAPRTTCSRRAPTPRRYRSVASRHDAGGDPRRRRRRPDRRARARRARLRGRRARGARRSPAARRAASRCPAPATGGRADLPAEHGFRFFPGFYRHVPDTMRRIPAGATTVVDRLTGATRILLAQARRPQRADRRRAPARVARGPRRPQPLPAGR